MRKMFSKNQIKEIVNQGIESGDVQVGTKLYEHSIYFEFDSDQSDTGLTLPIYIISNNPNPYSLNDFSVMLGHDGILSISPDDYGEVTPPIISLDVGDNDNIITNFGTEWASVADFEDTVTSL